MKKFIIIVSTLVALYIFGDYAYYHLGWYIDMDPGKPVTTFVKTEGTEFRILKDGQWEDFEIKGVNIGSGEPGQWSTDFDIDEESYYRWFGYIQEMGANTIRVYTIQADEFYNAFYAYNQGRDEPLYLIHGVWVNDYVQNSHMDAYDERFFDTLIEDCRTLVDVLHGNKKISLGRYASAGSGTYHHDISPWVIGYILGVEWEGQTVEFTNQNYKDRPEYTSYTGKYMYTDEDASAFESLLCRVGDKIIEYETERYKQQRLVAMSDWPTTDPFVYPEKVRQYLSKCAEIDVEKILCTEHFLSGQFASYHVYPYYPDYLSYVTDWTPYGIDAPLDFVDEDGRLNTYRAYLTALTNHHTMPVVISEFGVSTGRGLAQKDANTGRNQGHMSETEQGDAIVECYEDIVASGCAGCCVFSWQDEWFKRTWNTMYAIDMTRNPYWSDYQTNEQYFGLLSFDPGEDRCISYVDGDISEWTESDIVVQGENSSLSMKYDERFIYLLIYKKELDFEAETLYIPVDTTPKSGSNFCRGENLLFDRNADFIIRIHGKEDSEILVQERYEALRSTYSRYVYGFGAYYKENIPDVDSPEFVGIDMILKMSHFHLMDDPTALGETFPTGQLRYGNANPESDAFDSLADFIHYGDYIEIKIPWQLLNFADPSKMAIHDDYYDGNYGIEYITINTMYLGLSSASADRRIALKPAALEGWGNKVTYHERLKPSYYILQSVWRDES